MTADPGERFGRAVGRKARRRIRSRRESDSPWFWLGYLGVLGWSVAVPTLVGVAVGAWLDRVTDASFSWTLTAMVVGLAVGVVTASAWVRRETGDGSPEEEETDD